MWLKFLLGLILSLIYYWFNSLQNNDQNKSTPKSSILQPPNVEVPLPPSRSLLHAYKKAAVCSDKSICSNIGRVILQEHGNAIDAAIGTLLCNGLVTMQSMGLGGGVILTFYKRQTKKAIIIIGRERASLNHKYEDIKRLKKENYFAKSALSIAVPGELAAYHEAHRRYGSLPWFDIMQPTLKLCNIGYQLTRHQRDALFLNEQMVRKDEFLSKMFVDAKTNLFYKEGWHIKFPKQLCATYQLLANEGALTFYNGSLALLISKDLNEMGSPITMTDLNFFKAGIENAIKLDVDPYYIYLPRPPSSGHVIGFIIKILRYFRKEFSFTKGFNTKEVHRIIEALKFGFVKRWLYDSDVDYKALSSALATTKIFL